jgi:hypothetical protein
MASEPATSSRAPKPEMDATFGLWTSWTPVGPSTDWSLSKPEIVCSPEHSETMKSPPMCMSSSKPYKSWSMALPSRTRSPSMVPMDATAAGSKSAGA